MKEMNLNKQPYKLLVVDDEHAIADLVCDIFKSEGMYVDACYMAKDALDKLNESAFDIVIADIMMPGMDGFEMLSTIRRTSDVPVIFLTAKDQEQDIVIGLTIGADDFITKPFKPRELVARVKAHLRRSSQRHSASNTEDGAHGTLSSNGIELNVKSHVATVHDVPLQLTPKEFDILAMLMRHKGSPVPSKELYQTIWNEEADAFSANTIMVHIRHLRKKISDIDSSIDPIETAWGVGYKMKE